MAVESNHLQFPVLKIHHLLNRWREISDRLPFSVGL